MKKLLVATLLTLATLASPGSRSATQAPTAAAGPGNDPRQIAEAAMKLVVRDDMRALFEYIGKHMPIERAELDKIRDKSIDQRKMLPGGLGPAFGYSLASECRRGEALVRYIFIERRKRNFIRWQFVMYRPQDKWQISTFNWDTQYNDAFVAC